MLDGIPIQVNPHLPETVKDKDGKECRLLGVMVEPEALFAFPGDELKLRKIILLVEEVCNEEVPDRPGAKKTPGTH